MAWLRREAKFTKSKIFFGDKVQGRAIPARLFQLKPSPHPCSFVPPMRNLWFLSARTKRSKIVSPIRIGGHRTDGRFTAEPGCLSDSIGESQRSQPRSMALRGRISSVLQTAGQRTMGAQMRVRNKRPGRSRVRTLCYFPRSETRQLKASKASSTCGNCRRCSRYNWDPFCGPKAFGQRPEDSRLPSETTHGHQGTWR